jgi:hypothetical protein
MTPSSADTEMLHRFAVGKIEVTRIVEVNEPFLTPEKMFVEATPEAIAPYLEWLLPDAMCAETGRLILPVQTYVIRTPRHVALVDTCIGNHKSMAGFKRWAGRDDAQWLRSLAAAGVAPEAVDLYAPPPRSLRLAHATRRGKVGADLPQCPVSLCAGGICLRRTSRPRAWRSGLC